jgi:hypothetical protein
MGEYVCNVHSPAMNHVLSFAHFVFLYFLLFDTLTFLRYLFAHGIKDMAKFNKDNYLAFGSRIDPLDCPLLKVLKTNEYGMEVEASRSFDVGEEMRLGFHLCNSVDGSSFISADSLVVKSERMRSEFGNLCHRVTLLFSNIGVHDRERLIALSEELTDIPRIDKIGLN